MKKILHILSIAILMIGILSSCESSFLDTEPSDKLVPSTFFQSEKDLQLYVNSFYQRMLPDAMSLVTIDAIADYTSKNVSPQYIAGAYGPVNEPSWNWTNLRNINYFIENANNPLIPEEARNHYIGVARFFRAYFYYDKVKTYGDVPWYSKTMSTSDEDLYKARDSRVVVMDSVLADLNFATENIRDIKDNTSSTVTRQVALALKSRICLFEGTFRKYHTQLGLTSTANKFLEEAADAAGKAMESDKYRLVTGNPTKDYRSLFTSEAPVNTEVLWAVTYSNSLKRWHNITWQFNSTTYGSRWGLNKQFINTYLMADGTRFTDITGYDTIQFVREMANRDRRLAQTVRSIGYKRTDGSASPPNFTVTYTGYQILKFSLDDKRLDVIGESYNSIPLIRYAEILLNYAEAKAELGQFDSSVWLETIASLRSRAGVNSAEPATADSYMQTVFYPNVSDKYLLEIRRERGIELCYEGLRYDDLLRWKKGDLVEMDWKGIYVPALNYPMDLDGNGTPDVSFVTAVPAVKVPGVIYYIIDGTTSALSETDKGHVIWQVNEPRSFSEKKYLRPISVSDIVLNPNLSQNPGW
jgi:starch-binding outer membrane protein, SusD/RagB family